MNSRRAYITVQYAGKDMTANITQDLLSATYSDKASGESDELNLTVKDREGNWCRSWYPKVQSKQNEGEAVSGPVLSATINLENWYTQGDHFTLPCGTFEIDTCKYNLEHSVMEIKAMSVPISSSLRCEKKSQSWENATLEKIANDIATGADMKLDWSVADSINRIELDRVDQLEQSDLEFLMKLCTQYGISLKVTAGKIVCFDEADYEQFSPVETFTLAKFNGQFTDHRVLGGTVYQDTSDGVSESKVSYKDPKSGKLVETTFKPPKAPATGQKVNHNARPGNLKGDAFRDIDAINTRSLSRATSTQEDFDDIRADAVPTAIRQAKAIARAKNKQEWIVDLTVMGNHKIVGGVTINLTGLGVYDGKYLVDSATHTLGGGYQTSFKAHRVLEGY